MPFPFHAGERLDPSQGSDSTLSFSEDTAHFGEAYRQIEGAIDGPITVR